MVVCGVMSQVVAACLGNCLEAGNYEGARLPAVSANMGERVRHPVHEVHKQGASEVALII